MKPFNNQMFEDIRELCCCSAKAIAIISQRYDEDPRLVNRLFIEVYQKISDDVDNTRK